MLKEQSDCGLISIYFGESLIRNWTLQDEVFVFIGASQNKLYLPAAIVYVCEFLLYEACHCFA